MPSKAELEQEIVELKERLHGQAQDIETLTDDRDLAVARLTTLQRETDGRIQSFITDGTRQRDRITELEGVLNSTVATASLLALRCIDPKLADRITKVTK